MNQQFMESYKLHLNSDKLQEQYHNFDINQFNFNKTNFDPKTSEFYNYPFLRDQLFISFFKTLKIENISSFESSILSAQIEFFKKFVNPQFNPQMLTTSSTAKVSKCPFAPKTSNTPIKPFSFEPLSKVRYSIIENTHISDMNIDNLTVNIVKLETERSPKAKFHVFSSGIHHNVDFNNSNDQFILLHDSKFEKTTPVNFDFDHQFSHDTTNEIIKVKQSLTAADILFLFPEKVLVINSIDQDRFLNLIVYLNILGLPLTLQTVKSIGLNSKRLALPPSFLEPYADILNPEYIHSNIDLFQ